MSPTPEPPPSDTPITDAREQVFFTKDDTAFCDVTDAYTHARTLERAARRLADAMEALRAARRKVDYERSYGGPGGCQVNEADLHKASGEADTALSEWRKLEAGR